MRRSVIGPRRLDPGWLGFAASALVAAVTLARFGRSWSFFYDEWGVIEYRRSGGIDALLAPLNGHLLAVPIAIYRVLFALAGIGSYTPYRWVMIATLILLAALLHAVLRRILPPGPALALVLPILFLGRAWEVLLWTMNLGFVLPMIAGAAILLLPGDAPGSRAGRTGRWAGRAGRWAGPAGAALLLVALASSGLGIAVAVGAVLESVLDRRRRAQLPWRVGPAVLYVLWFVWVRPSTLTPASLRHVPGADPRGDVGSLGVSSANLSHVPAYVLHIAESAASGLVGAAPRLLWLLVVVGLLVAGVVRRRRPTIRLLCAGAALLAFWVLAGVARAGDQQPQASRYVFPGAVLLVIILAEAWAGDPWLGRATGRRAARLLPAVALTAAVGVIVVSGVVHLHSVSRSFSPLFVSMKRTWARIECPADHAPVAAAPDPALMPFVRVGPFRAAVRDLGSPVPAAALRSLCGG